MEQEFLEKMIDILDCEQEITMASVLDEIEEWDSLSFVSFLAMANASYRKSVLAKDVRTAKTTGDLYNLIKD